MNKLKLIRLERGLSQFELSYASGVPRYVIQLAENAIRLPSIEHLTRLADVLGIKAQDLMPQVEEEDGQ